MTRPTEPRPILRRALEFDVDLSGRVDGLFQIPHLVARLGRGHVGQLNAAALPCARRGDRGRRRRHRPRRGRRRRRRLGRGVVVPVPAAPFRAPAGGRRGAEGAGAPPRGGGARGGGRAGAVVDRRVADVVAVPRLGHLDDQVGHGHFNVELDRVGEGVELHVPGKVSNKRDALYFEAGKEKKKDLHKRVAHAHHADNENVHGQREANDEQVEPGEPLVLFQAVVDEVARDDDDKVQVERGVGEQVQHLFAAVPAVVDPDVLVRDLQPRRDPDQVHGHVDGRDEGRHADLEPPHHVRVVHQDRAPVDDDLQEELDLEGPQGDYIYRET